MNRVLQTLGQGNFIETEFKLPPLLKKDIQVRSIFTGICRSDIDMMTGGFGPLPLNMQGHEGLGQVVKIGKEVEDVEVGDFVATRGEPAYADFYNAKENEYVKVPEANPKYIIEPVACGLNLIHQPIKEITARSGPRKHLLILGSGFLAWVAYHAVKLYNLDFTVHVVGSSNKDIWAQETKLYDEPQVAYDVVIDLSTRTDVFDTWLVQNEGLIVLGAQKTVTTDFKKLLWKACTIIFPSPRTKNFYAVMQDAVFWIQTGKLNVDKFWTKGYNRDTEWQQAFHDGLNRPLNYSRGYIYWNGN
jgi:D-arabinose 1-dehydrogenase-like Zn-dependent alcohol dehydrogenase